MSNPADYVFSDSEFMTSLVKEVVGLVGRAGNGILESQKMVAEHELAVLTADKEYAANKLRSGQEMATNGIRIVETIVTEIQSQSKKNEERYRAAMEQINDDPKVESADVSVNPFGVSVHIRRK